MRHTGAKLMHQVPKGKRGVLWECGEGCWARQGHLEAEPLQSCFVIISGIRFESPIGSVSSSWRPDRLFLCWRKEQLCTMHNIDIKKCLLFLKYSHVSFTPWMSEMQYYF